MKLEWVSGGLLSLDVEGRGPQCCQNSLKLPEIMKKKKDDQNYSLVNPILSI